MTLSPLTRKFFINGGFFKYVEFWKVGLCKDETYVKMLSPYMDS
jgi:hypothetical protein